VINFEDDDPDPPPPAGVVFAWRDGQLIPISPEEAERLLDEPL
jgi:hypothetical protein